MGLADEAEDLAARLPIYGEALRRIMDALALEPSVRVEGGFAALDEEQRMSPSKSWKPTCPSTSTSS